MDPLTSIVFSNIFHIFHIPVYSKSTMEVNGSINCLVTDILQNIFVFLICFGDHML